MDVNEHDRLSKITLPHKLKLKEKHIDCCSTCYSHNRVFNEFYLLDNLASGKYNSTQQITSKRQKCPDVAFLNRSKQYHSAVGQGWFQDHCRV
jgi:hypothetical protein